MALSQIWLEICRFLSGNTPLLDLDKVENTGSAPVKIRDYCYRQTLPRQDGPRWSAEVDLH